jgi:hypothetical protein
VMGGLGRVRLEGCGLSSEGVVRDRDSTPSGSPWQSPVDVFEVFEVVETADFVEVPGVVDVVDVVGVVKSRVGCRTVYESNE